jgi:hypothetical protein
VNPGEKSRPQSGDSGKHLSVLGGVSREPSPRPGSGLLGLTGSPNLAAALAQKRAEAAKEGRDSKSTLLSGRGTSPTSRSQSSTDSEDKKSQQKAAAPSAPKVFIIFIVRFRWFVAPFIYAT